MSSGESGAGSRSRLDLAQEAFSSARWTDALDLLPDAVTADEAVLRIRTLIELDRFDTAVAEATAATRLYPADRVVLDSLAAYACVLAGDVPAAGALLAPHAELRLRSGSPAGTAYAYATTLLHFVRGDIRAAKACIAGAFGAGPTSDAAARLLFSAFLAAEEDFTGQSKVVDIVLRDAREKGTVDVSVRARALEYQASLARETGLPIDSHGLLSDWESIEWTHHLSGMRFRTAHKIGWRLALDGDFLGGTRFLRRATMLAENDIDRMCSYMDAAMISRATGDSHAASVELLEGLVYAERVNWGEIRDMRTWALFPLVLALAPSDPRTAARYLKIEAGTSEGPLSVSSDDRRREAYRQQARGHVALGLGDNEAAKMHFAPAYFLCDELGLSWRAADCAIQLGRITHESSWFVDAKKSLQAFPRSWFSLELDRLERVDRVLRPLTKAQRTAFDLLAQNMTNAEVAKAMGCSVLTARNHRHAVYRVLGVKRDADLIALAREHGLVG